MKNSVAASVALYVRLKGKSVSEEDILAGLPPALTGPNPQMPPIQQILQRAESKLGLHLLLKKCPINQIAPATLPLILLLKDGSSCLLTELDPAAETSTETSANAETQPHCTLLFPDSELVAHKKPVQEILEQYSGYLIYIGHRAQMFWGENQAQKRSGKNHWFWHAIKLCTPIYFDVILASFVISLFALVGPLFTMNVYDRVVPNNALETLWVLGIGAIVVTIFDTILKFLRTYFTEVAAKKSDVLISSRIFQKILNLKMKEAPKNIGALASSLREYDAIRNFLTSSVMLVIVDLPFTAILLTVVYYLAGKIVLVPITMMSIIAIYALLVRKPIHHSVASNYEDASRKNSLVVETLGGLTDIKHLNSAGLFQGKWEAVVSAIAEKSIVARLISSTVGNLTGALIQMNTVLTVIMGVYMIKDHQMTMGALIAIMILSSKIIAPVGQLVGLISSWDQTLLSFESIKAIMQKEEEDSDRELIFKNSFNGDIEFQGVSFAYPDSEKEALSDVTFKVKKGEKVAILGRMGAGKSTINRLVMGFYSPTKGRVLLDGIDVNELSKVQMRSHINFVPQDFTLFAGTIRENLLLGNPAAGEQELIRATAASGLNHLIQASPRGLDSLIQEKGQNLSGGQRQSIVIARAFVKDGAMALLDEPTSSMDSNTEAMVKHNLRVLLKDKTMLLTTHKNSMLELVNRILVLDAGRLVFDGTPQQFNEAFAPKEGGAEGGVKP